MGHLTKASEALNRTLVQAGIAIALSTSTAIILSILVDPSLGLIVAALAFLVIPALAYRRLYHGPEAPLRDVPLSALPPIPTMFGRSEE